MSENRREYENAIIHVIFEFVITYCNKNIPLDIQNNISHNIPILRQLINESLTLYNKKVPENINQKIDIILQYELSNKKITDASTLLKYNNISIWKGDITTIYIDCIVNAANSQGSGCYLPGHKCIDNIIHSRAGPRMRDDCKNILGNREIETGDLIITLGYNIPARYVFHVVGPIYKNNTIMDNRLLLIKCYLNCLNKLRDIKKRSIAFCCISTGEYGYPKNEACIIAVNTVKRWMNENKDYPIHVVFCVYTDEDMNIYKKIEI